jgi:hypothetical protein
VNAEPIVSPQEYDPLKIHYLVILGTDRPTDVTPFQGFSVSWRAVSWAMEMLATLPADVLERSYSFDDVTAQRMGGLRPLTWAPLSLSALEEVTAEDLGVFVVLFSGEKECAARVADWASRQKRQILHVSTQEVEGAYGPAKFTFELLQAYCLDLLARFASSFSDEQRTTAEALLRKWAEPEERPSGLLEKAHNITRPNYMTLARASRSVENGRPFIGRSEKEYTDTILESTRAVTAVRDQVGIRPFHYWSLLRPALILAEPALYRPRYKAMKLQGLADERIISKSLRWIQTQKGLHSEIDVRFWEEFQKSPGAQSVISTRASELDTFTLGVGLHAAQSVAAVVRLSPGVNHVFPALSNYARSIRSDRFEARLKTRRLFDSIQDGLRDAVGEDRLAFLQKGAGPIKIISDAPIEWLPVGNLPLSLRYDCSRINATPGNLLMALLAEPLPLVYQPDAFRKILLVTAFADDDPLRAKIVGALKAIQGQWENKVEIIIRKAQSRGELIDALNGFDGLMMIFDGHGADNAEEPVGKLIIGKEAIDVWELRGQVRVPPIVILSACDTHGIDASSQATVGNGFLFLGARTVLATLLPVGGNASAIFIGRLIYRLADFLPTGLHPVWMTPA